MIISWQWSWGIRRMAQCLLFPTNEIENRFKVVTWYSLSKLRCKSAKLCFNLIKFVILQYYEKFIENRFLKVLHIHDITLIKIYFQNLCCLLLFVLSCLLSQILTYVSISRMTLMFYEGNESLLHFISNSFRIFTDIFRYFYQYIEALCICFRVSTINKNSHIKHIC